MDNNTFKQYKKYKEIVNSQNTPYFEGYLMGSVLSLKIYHLIDNYSKISTYKKIWSILIKIIIVLFSDTYELKYDKKNPKSKLLFMYSVSNPNRKDLQRLFDNLYNLYSEEDKITFIGNEKKRFAGFKYKNITKFVKVYKSLKSVSEIYLRFMISLLIIQSLEIKELVSRIKVIDYCAFITFCDVFEQDNFLVQTFKMNSIPTISLQHGQAYCKIGFENNDDIEYENFSSDYKFSWGEQTMQEMIKGGINPQRIINVGSPKYVGKIRREIKKDKKDVFGVVLNNVQNIEANREMISFANRLCENMRLFYSIKIHPADDISNYQDLIQNNYFVEFYKHEEIEDYLSNVFVSIVNYSSIYMELLYYYHPTLLYRNKLNEVIFDESFNTFNNYDGLLTLMKEFDLNYDTYEPLIKELSHYFIEDNFEYNSKKFISNLLDNSLKQR